uniref:Major facilitator superfamily (MFS) profile domain-containing protein n=3 Tax=Lotharella globosa TaxID=91324 RepID=A0A7S4DKH5_9EUKA
MFMLNWGPNITTFILPAEVYPPKVRSTMNGISAALGKVGAIIGTFIYQPIYDEHGIPVLMVVAGCISLIGAALSFWTIKPSKEHTGEDDTREYNTVSVEDNTDEVGHLRRVVNDQ